MLKQSSCRNQRSRGFKVKHAIQTCLLISICIWLLYQAKHSHGNYKSHEERFAKVSSGRGIIKMGRKDIYGGRVDEMEEVEDSKPEEPEDEGRWARDEDMDEHDQEEPEGVEDLIDVEDKDNEEGSEKQQSQDKSNHVAYKGLLEEQFQNEGKNSNPEVREEHYDLESKSFGSTLYREDNKNWTQKTIRS